MSRKDFVAVAAAINASFTPTHDITDEDRRATAQIAIREVATNLANAFADSNPRFNRNIFLAACGVSGGVK